MRFSQLGAIALTASPAWAHLSIWDPSIFGYLPDEVNTDNMSQPLQEYTFEQWWWHGVLDQPPVDGEIFELPANGQIETVIASNKGNTPFGHGFTDEDPTKAPEPWLNENGWGNMHAPERTDVAGSALAIAYKSDQYDVEPSDFVVFSVAHDSPARQLQSWDVPNLPACPDDKCMCSWFWIHKSVGGTDQMYMTPFVCKVTGATNAGKVAGGVAPLDCRDDQSKCVAGAKNPMYWKNLEGNNMPNEPHDAPIYSDGYGFADGAQNDIFES